MHQMSSLKDFIIKGKHAEKCQLDDVIHEHWKFN